MHARSGPSQLQAVDALHDLDGKRYSGKIIDAWLVYFRLPKAAKENFLKMRYEFLVEVIKLFYF